MAACRIRAVQYKIVYIPNKVATEGMFSLDNTCMDLFILPFTAQIYSTVQHS